MTHPGSCSPQPEQSNETAPALPNETNRRAQNPAVNTDPATQAPVTTVPGESQLAEEVDLNQIVAYNLAAVRKLRGWTQTETAARLEPVLGRRITQATMSALERTYDGPADRRRQFDAQDLGVFSKVFGVPIVFFFLPPPGDRRRVVGVGDEHRGSTRHAR